MSDLSQPRAAVTAQRLLRAKTGLQVNISASRALTRERSVWRCAVDGDPGMPASVIVRTHREVGDWRTDSSYLFNDYAATSFLSDLQLGLTARVLAADLAAGVVVTEDLGSGPSLGEVLSGSDQAGATRAILSYSRGLGILHAYTAGNAATYGHRRRALGCVDPGAYRTTLNERSLHAASHRLVTTATIQRILLPSIARSELDDVLRALVEPGTFLALSSGDPCPYNCVITDGLARFFDFELAGYRHALLDAAYLYLGFHACYDPGRLPDQLLREAEHTYRRSAGTHIPAMLDEDMYHQQLTLATAAWAVLAAVEMPRVDTFDAAVGQRVAQTCRIINLHIAHAERHQELPALTNWFAGLLAAARSRLPGRLAGASLIPAFR